MVAIKKVMLVDDEPDIRTIGQISLARIGRWQVVLASSGVEAVELAAREQPDVILLDFMMPGIDGQETLARLRRQAVTAATPVLFMTAKVQKLNRYLAMGALAVITKPFNPITLPDEIRAHLRAHPGVQDLPALTLKEPC